MLDTGVTQHGDAYALSYDLRVQVGAVPDHCLSGWHVLVLGPSSM